MLLYGSEPSAERVEATVKVDLPPGPDAVSAARDHLVEALSAWGWDRVTDAATLCVSELTTVLLAMECAAMQLVVLRGHEHLTVELRCCGARHRFSSVLSDHARVGARGIALIDDLVPLWGVRAADDGEAIWFEVR